MAAKVKIGEVMDMMDGFPEEYSAMVNTNTGEVILVEKNYLRKAEDEVPYEGLPDWEQETMKLAYDIIDDEDDKYIPLPSSFDIDDYDMIERFSASVKDPVQRDELLHTIRGKGAFRRFRDHVEYFGLLHDWYAYRDQRYRDIAIDFCEMNGLEWVE